MKDQDKTKEQLLDELIGLRQRVATLEASERRYRTIIDTVPLTIGEINRDGVVVFANAATEKMYGYTPEEIVGSSSWDRIEEGPAREAFRAWFSHTMSEQPPLSPVFGSRVKKNGERIDIRGDCNYLRNEAGEVTGLVTVVADITERKRAEEALQKAHDGLDEIVRERTIELSKANERLRIFQQFAETSGQGFSMADLGGHLLYMNPALCQMLGEDRPHDRIGQHISIYYPDEVNRTRETERFPVLMRDGYWQGELPMLSRQGTSIPTWHNTFLIRDETGKPFRIAVVITDISERKHAEEALRESERRLREMLENVHLLAVMLDREGKITFCNDFLLQLAGWQREEVMGINWFDAFVPANQAVKDLFLKAMACETIPPQHENDITTRTGERRRIAWSNTVLRDFHGKTIGTTSIGEDITERKQAEDALQQSEARFRSYFEQGLIGMAVSSPDKRWIQVNDRYCDMLGYSRDELLGMKWTDLTHPDELERNLIPLNRALAGESEQHTLEKRFIRKDGSIMYATVFARCFRRQDGSVDHFLSLVEDITERKLAQEALERERRTLEHMLRASDHERQLIAYDIHDGLAQYLTGSIMQLQMSDHLRDGTPEEAAKAFNAGVAMVRESLSEARRLISGVRPPILDESGVVAAVAHLVHDPAFDKGPKIDFRSRVTFSRLNPVMENVIYRIAQEGLSNARNHSKSKKIVVSLVQRGERLRIEVRDWGVGFDPKTVQENHFGLEGIRERARLLGGKATIESRLGHGTQIVVDLPIVLRRPEDEQPEENEE